MPMQRLLDLGAVLIAALGAAGGYRQFAEYYPTMIFWTTVLAPAPAVLLAVASRADGLSSSASFGLRAGQIVALLSSGIVFGAAATSPAEPDTAAHIAVFLWPFVVFLSSVALGALAAFGHSLLVRPRDRVA